jgi:hypothetical protein
MCLSPGLLNSFMLDWPNFHGLAPLHVAAEKGFEDVGRVGVFVCPLALRITTGY